MSLRTYDPPSPTSLKNKADYAHHWGVCVCVRIVRHYCRTYHLSKLTVQSGPLFCIHIVYPLCSELWDVYQSFKTFAGLISGNCVRYVGRHGGIWGKELARPLPDSGVTWPKVSSFLFKHDLNSRSRHRLHFRKKKNARFKSLKSVTSLHNP